MGDFNIDSIVSDLRAVNPDEQTKVSEEDAKASEEVVAELREEVAGTEDTPEEASEDDDRGLFSKIPERDVDVVVRKKRATKEEPEVVGEATDEEFEATESDSDKFKRLVGSQKKFKAKAEDFEKKYSKLQEEKEELEKKLEEHSIYREYYDLENSPEFYEAHKSFRDDLVNQALKIGNAYKENPEIIQEIFEQGDIRAAKQYARDNISDNFAESEMAKLITDFFVNKEEEVEALSSKDPRKRREEYRQQAELIKNQRQQEIVKNNDLSREDTAKRLTATFGNMNELRTLYPNLLSDDVMKKTQTDLVDAIQQKTTKSFDTMHRVIAEAGANLSLQNSRNLGIQAMDQSAVIVADKVIGILMDENKQLLKEVKSYQKYSSPGISEQGTDSKDSKTEDDSYLDKLKEIVGV